MYLRVVTDSTSSSDNVIAFLRSSSIARFPRANISRRLSFLSAVVVAVVVGGGGGGGGGGPHTRPVKTRRTRSPVALGGQDPEEKGRRRRRDTPLPGGVTLTTMGRRVHYRPSKETRWKEKIKVVLPSPAPPPAPHTHRHTHTLNNKQPTASLADVINTEAFTCTWPFVTMRPEQVLETPRRSDGLNCISRLRFRRGIEKKSR